MAAARTIDGPPMSISSTSSSNDEPGLPGRLGERVQVDDDELERRDPGGGERLAVVRAPAVREEAGVDARMERLHPAVEHLREAGDGGDVGDRQARLAQRARRATGADTSSNPRATRPRAELGEAGLVGDREQGAPRDGQRASTTPGRRVDGRPARR